MDGTSLRRIAIAAVTVLTVSWGPPVSAASLDDVALDQEVLNESVSDLAAQLEERAGLSGYYDFEYNAANDASNSGFRQHHVSLFVTRTWKQWRFFTEIEFEDFKVHDGDSEVGDTKNPITGAGAVSVESGWAEYLHADWLHIRGGKFLLPEYWNVNHYPNTVLSTNRPLMVRNVFPTDTNGVMAYGVAYAGPMGATYNLYYGNGQSPNSSKEDDNQGKAVGGHLTLHFAHLLDGVSRLDIGAAGYTENAPTEGGQFDVFGVDTQVNVGRVELLAEYASRTSDVSSEGLYVQPSVRVWREVRCFYRYGYVDPSDGPKHERHTVGVNFRPRPDIALKLEVNTNDFSDDTDSFEALAASVALFF